MSDDALHALDALDAPRAQARLLELCGSRRWAAAVAAGRPYATADDLGRAADAAFADLETRDWLEAFAAHPRIGATQVPDRTAAAEQAGASAAGDDVRDALRLGNIEYEARFGHVFLICASGLSGEQMLTALRERLDADPDDELRTAAREQAAITRLRMGRLLNTGAGTN